MIYHGCLHAEALHRSIVQNESPLEVSPAHFGLVPHEYNLPPEPVVPRVPVRVLPNPWAGASGPTNETPRRRAMVDDLPPEILGLDTVVKLRALGLLTLKEAAEQVSGPQLMYELGLSRDEIRDLYYYVRDNYGLKMNIGQEFGISLHIFRPEFRRKHPLPKK